jgi:cell division protease FtsH
LNQFSRTAALWIFIVIMLVLLYNVIEKPDREADEISYSQFRAAVEEGKIKKLEIKEPTNEIVGEYKDGATPGHIKFRTAMVPNDDELIPILVNRKIEFKGGPREEPAWYLLFFGQWAPMLLLIGVWIFFMRQIQVGGGKALSFGKSRAAS